MNRHAATRSLRRLAQTAGVRLPWMHPHMLRHTFVTTMLDIGVDLRDCQAGQGGAAVKWLDQCPVLVRPRSHSLRASSWNR